MMALEVRLLGPGDEQVVRALTDRERYEPLTQEAAKRFLLEPRNLMVVAFEGHEAVGSVLGYLLQRRHGHERSLFVYDIEVAEAHRRRGVGTSLMNELFRVGREGGAVEAFVLTDEANTGAMHFYRSLGAYRERDDEVMFDFEL
jgi:aminoglycoside 3-N-acetyltransferase I